MSPSYSKGGTINCFLIEREELAIGQGWVSERYTKSRDGVGWGSLELYKVTVASV